METHDPNPLPSTRSPIAGVSALLIVGLLIGVTASALRPGVRALHRDATAELQATRQIAQTIARAVRELTGSDVHKPVVRCSTSVEFLATGNAWAEAASSDTPRRVAMLLESLLSLPPPRA